MVKELSKGTGRIGAPCLLAINSIKCLTKPTSNSSKSRKTSNSMMISKQVSTQHSQHLSDQSKQNARFQWYKLELGSAEREREREREREMEIVGEKPGKERGGCHGTSRPKKAQENQGEVNRSSNTHHHHHFYYMKNQHCCKGNQKRYKTTFLVRHGHQEKASISECTGTYIAQQG
jgi:hypothetical protein